MTLSSPTPKNEGPQCRACRQSEARCAFLGGCCGSCGHFRWLDSNGDEIAQQVNPTGRPTTAKCATESGYQAHRKRRESACFLCRQAHSRHNMQKKASA